MTQLESALARATARLADALDALAGRRRVDLTGLTASSLALLVARLAARTSKPVVLVTADTESARRAVGDVELFLGATDSDGASSNDVLAYPAHEVSPFLDVAPDRRAAME
ncbi:MAG: hypothetical protein K8H88_05475, partial [Sandaracinaceae bacterium]|nr:hypothetical protein [Sandaracinaceae bacterium]